MTARATAVIRRTPHVRLGKFRTRAALPTLPWIRRDQLRLQQPGLHQGVASRMLTLLLFAL